MNKQTPQGDSPKDKGIEEYVADDWHTEDSEQKKWFKHSMNKLLQNRELSAKPMYQTKDKGIEKLARWLHEEYEDKARLYNWKTQEKCRVDFDDLPLENKKVMLAMALEIDRRIQQERKEIVEWLKKEAKSASEVYDGLDEYFRGEENQALNTIRFINKK